MNLNELANAFREAGYKNVTGDSDNIHLSCPTARYSSYPHKNGDSHPSASVFMGTKGDLMLYCPVCGDTKPLKRSLKIFRFAAEQAGYDPAMYNAVLDALDGVIPEPQSRGAIEGNCTAGSCFSPFPEGWLNSFPPGNR